MFLASQIIGYLGLVTSVLSFQFNKGKRFYAFQIVMKLLFATHYVLLWGFSGAALNAVGLLNCIFCYYRAEGKPFAQKRFWVYVFAFVYGVVGVTTIYLGDKYGALVTVASVATAFMLYSPSVRIVRYYQFFVVSPCWLIYNFCVSSYSGITTEIVNIISVLIAFWRYRGYAKKLVINCAAKINLVLSVPKKRDDGFHEISTVMQTIGLYDTITVRRDENIIVKSNLAPEDEDNICYKAAELFSQFGGAYIKIKKCIPMAAGLGGGSSDAAGVLNALNELHGNPFTRQELEDMAISLGSDVPFFISGGTQRVDGKGEKLKKCADFNGHFVLIKQGAKMSTGEMYSQLDKNGLSDCTEKVDNFCELLECGKMSEASELIFNDFESVCKCDEIKSDLLSCGAKAACLSGSGPTVFGLFFDENDALSCAQRLKNKYNEIYVCSSVIE